MSSDAAAAPRRRRSVRTRERIVAAAVAVFARRGLHGARVADIAEEAGIAYGLVYHHFRNKEEILAAIFQERWGRHLGYLEEVAASPAPVRERLGRLVHFWVETYRNDPDLMTVMINEISRSYEFIESHDVGTVIEAFEIVERMLRQAQENGELRPGLDCRLAAYLVLGAAEMVLTGYVLGTLGRTAREQFAADERQLVAMLVEGFCGAEPV
ncbi:MAG TPA: TetR/AcrR family transcriptional regulator [Candidatus Dormibacteraeota bacterium]|jgi:AcrR family transcriptional regulator|nr:TetR/AcrR family transcriptional regulator [Candidatus Dormibacteraeota bacterium]